MAEAAAAGIAYALKNVAEGAALLAKGIYDPTQPLRATLTPISDTSSSATSDGKVNDGARLPSRTQHSLCVIKGRGYIFGGFTSSRGLSAAAKPSEVVGGSNAGAQLVDNDMHIIILPSSGMESVDYTSVNSSSSATSSSAVPCPRDSHAAAAIEDRIYLFGGADATDSVLEEDGRIWVFDTSSKEWQEPLTPASMAAPIPSARRGHIVLASEHPRPKRADTYAGVLPQDPPAPGTALPEPEEADSFGSIIVQGGIGKDGQVLTDLWCFDIASRTWRELPEPPTLQKGLLGEDEEGENVSMMSLALVQTRLYAFAGAQTSYLDLLTPGAMGEEQGGAVEELGLVPKGPWLTFSSPEEGDGEGDPHPGPRSGAAMFPVTTGQGRNYLLLMGGRSPSGEVLEDLWALQLQPEGMTAASFKDAARKAINKDTKEAQWAEVKYYNADGVMIQEGQNGRGIGLRTGFAAARSAEIDGGSVVLWGGSDSNGDPRHDGLIISIE